MAPASDEGAKVSGLLLSGLNDVVGPIVNSMAYNDTVLSTAADVLHVGALRHPGGTVANYWSLVNGSYVGCDGTTRGCKCSPYWDYCKHSPPETPPADHGFSAANFLAAPVGQRTIVFDVNVFSLSPKGTLAQLRYLHRVAARRVERIELGNEFYLPVYAWRINSTAEYIDRIRPVVALARSLFPGVRIAAVANAKHGAWNAALAQHRDLYDAVTVHKYSPSNKTIAALPESERLSALAGWGAESYRSIASELLVDWPDGIEVWRTEYNYPSWGSGYPLPELANGALHGMYWASNVLSAISYTLATNYSKVKFPVVMLHLMIDQIGVGWGARSGIVRVAGAGDVEAMRVNGLAQIFSHFARVSSAGMVWPLAPSKGCGMTTIRGFPATECLMGALFDSHVVVLNRCSGNETSTLPVAVRSSLRYSASDAGGWGPLPDDPDILPWSTGPLDAQVWRSENPNGKNEVELPGLTLSFFARA